MKAIKDLLQENEELKARLAEAEELLTAIKNGEVDAFVTDDQQVFTLKSADYAYRVLVETMNEGAATIGLDGIVLYCNTRFAEMLKFSPEQILGRSIYDFVMPADASHFRDILHDRSSKRGNVSLKKSDKSALPVLFSCNQMQKETAGTCVVFTDLSQQIEAQKEMERVMRLSDIGILATTVAHELRNPLAAIGMAAHNIKRKANNPDLDKHLANIEKKVGESNQIITNLLFYSRLKPPKYEKINFREMIEECAEALERFRKKGVVVMTRLDTIRDIQVEADPVQIREVFNNLLNNAHDAVSAEEGRIKIAVENEDEFVKVVIEDNGPGIAQDILDKIFDPFFTTKAKGTGLGLSICRQIINMHEGSIGVKSELGQGTSIAVRLPKKERINGK